MNSNWILLELAFLSGVVHVLAPDHWMPASILSWQRNWKRGQNLAFAAGIYFFHVLLGALLYWMFSPMFNWMSQQAIFGFALILIVASALVRLVRMGDIKSVILAGPRSRWGVLACYSLLGPCETLIPFLMKAKQLGVSIQLTVLVYFLGTILSGVLCMELGQKLWNRPLWLPRSLNWAVGDVSASLPALASIALVLGALFRIA